VIVADHDLTLFPGLAGALEASRARRVAEFPRRADGRDLAAVYEVEP
jgi:hypothetical protein